MKNGTWIPDNLQKHMIASGLKLTHLFIVSAIHGFERSGRPYFASNKYIGHQLGLEPRSIRQLITKLESTGWLKRSVTVGNSGSERIIATTEQTKNAIKFPPVGAEKDLPPRNKSSSNSIDNNKSNNKDLTTTSTQVLLSSDDAIRHLIASDIGIDKGHEVFIYYDVAYRWSLLRKNVDISNNPNTTVISNLLNEYASFGSLGDFVFFLDSRWIERKVEYRKSPVNLAWLLLLDCHDDIMKEGILSIEGCSEYTIASVNELVRTLSPC